MTRSRATLALLIGLVAVLVAVLATTAEEVEEVVSGRPSLEAQTTPSLAAQRLLDALGVPTTSMDGLHSLPPVDHVLIIATPTRDRLRRQREALVRWVSEGGHLIFEATPVPFTGQLEAPPDPLAEAFDLSTRNYHDHAEQAVVTLDLPDGTSHDIELNGTRCVEDLVLDPLWVSAWGLDHDCGSALQIGMGQGRVTAFGDLSWMFNDTIGEHDHAAALWHLATAAGVPAGARIVYQDQVVGLASLLLNRAWTLLVAAAALLLVWIASASQRFGPRRTPPSRDRRDRLAHVEAVGDFLWRHRRHQALVDATRQAFLRSRGSQGSQDPAALAAQLGVDPAPLHQALEAQIPRDPTAFTQVIQQLERLRRKR